MAFSHFKPPNGNLPISRAYQGGQSAIQLLKSMARSLCKPICQILYVRVISKCACPGPRPNESENPW